MRAFITHDHEGNITSVAIPASDLQQGDIELVSATGVGGESLRIADVEIAKSVDAANVGSTHKLDAETGKLVRKK
jgi:hypothetical protein